MKIAATVSDSSTALVAGRTTAGFSILLRLSERLDLPTFVALFAFWAFCNPYFGIGSGSLIYTARALADLDPTGVGRDMMLANDGQSGFTLFTFLMREIAARCGVPGATMLLSGFAMVVSFLSFAIVAERMAPKRVATLAIVFGAALPAAYGGFQLFAYAEAAATPRPLAEALVLCGLAALLSRRRALAGLLMVGAALLHPIMALPGVVMLLLWFAIEDIRWISIIVALVVIAVGAAFLGFHPVDRVLTIVDPEWRALLLERNPQLFPTLWPNGWIGRLAARDATILVAAGLTSTKERRLFLLALAVGLIGLAVAYLLDERVTSLLLLQAQTWRMVWLSFALANVAAAVCGFELWKRDGISRIVLALLALSWIWGDQDRMASLFAITAVAIHFGLRSRLYAVPPAVLRFALIVLLTVGIAGLVMTQTAIHDIFASAPRGYDEEARRTVALLDERTPFALLAAVLLISGFPRFNRLWASVASLCILTLAFLYWDQRSEANVYLDSGAGASDLQQLVATRPGEVYWINGSREAWIWLGRPQWLAAIQGAGIVFSRETAIRYRRRADLAIHFGLADDDILSPLLEPHAARLPLLTPANVEGICAAADAPAWIVAPLAAGTKLSAGIAGTEWLAPVEMLEPIEHGTRYEWLRIIRYAVVPCANR